MRCVVVVLIFVGVLVIVPTIAAGQSGAGAAFKDGLAAYRSGNVEAAVPALERALAADSSRQRTYVVLASALLQTSRPERALQVADAGLDRFPDRPALHLARAQAFSAQEQWKAALEAYRRVERKHRRGTELPPRISIEQVRSRIGSLHRLLGQKQIRDGRLDAALSHFKEARARLPDSAATHADVAAVFLKQRRWQLAVDAAEQGLERAPNHPRLLRLRGEALMRAGRTEAAVSDLGRLYQQRPDDVDVGLIYGQALLASGQTTAGRKVFETLLDRHPQDRTLYDTLADFYKQQRNYDAALNVLRRERQQFPEDAQVPLQIGRLYEKQNRYDAARAVYDTAQALASPHEHAPSLARAKTFAAEDSLSAAARAYRRLLTRSHEHETALRQLGQVYQRQGAWTDARDVYERLRTGPADSTDIFVELGRVYENLEQPEKAFSAYRTAVEKKASHPRPYYRYAVLLYQRGDTSQAFAAAERALRHSLRAVRQLQQAQLGRLQGNTPSTSRASVVRSPRNRLRDYNRVAEQAFSFFADTFPSRRTEPVIADLLDQYDRAGRLHYLTGRYYQERGRSDEAVDQFRQAVRETPDLRSAHLALGRFHAEHGNLSNAIQAYERARSLDPGAPDAYRALLDLYQQRGALDTLIERWQARYRTDPENEVLREHLIEALHKANRYEAARALVQADSTAG